MIRTPGHRHPRLHLAGLLLTIALGSSTIAQQAADTTRLPPLQAQTVENTQILVNPGFETPDLGWGLYEWPPREKTGDRLTGNYITYSQDVVHSGRYALRFDFTKLTPERLLAARQDLKPDVLAPYEGLMIRSSAWIWVASGPTYYQGSFGTRQWGEPGAPPLDHHIIPLGGPVGEWILCSQDFRLTLGSTRRIDANIWLPNLPDSAQAPVVYVDDVSLEVLADPPLAAERLCGKVISAPDDRVPVLISVAEKVWQDGFRALRWDVTSADGTLSYVSGESELRARQAVVEPVLPDAAAGELAVRLALGRKSGERSHEVLLSIMRTEGPFGN